MLLKDKNPTTNTNTMETAKPAKTWFLKDSLNIYRRFVITNMLKTFSDLHTCGTKNNAKQLLFVLAVSIYC